MAGNSKNRRGVRNITINRKSYRFVPGSLSVDTRDISSSVIENSGGLVTVTDNTLSVSFSVFLECGERLSDLQNLCDADVSVEYYDGRVMTWRGSSYTGDGTFDGETGQATLSFTASTFQETPGIC